VSSVQDDVYKTTHFLTKAYPDVAAQGQFLKIFHKGVATLIGGTSASSPSLAAFVALLNDVRLKQKLPSLGFLNPFIYSTGLTGFNDITIGTSTGCGTFGFNVPSIIMSYDVV